MKSPTPRSSHFSRNVTCATLKGEIQVKKLATGARKFLLLRECDVRIPGGTKADEQALGSVRWLV